MSNRMLGRLYGQAIGDALGFATEGMSKNEVVNNYPNGVAKYSDIIHDDRRRGCPIGGLTDDTEMTLLILESLVDTNDLNTTLKTFTMNWHTVKK